MKFGVENPGYRKITKIYDENGVNWDYVNIDDKGMKVDEVIERLKDIKCGAKPTSCPAQLAKSLQEHAK